MRSPPSAATLTAKLVDGNVQQTDAAGGTSMVIMTDLDADNGLIRVTDTVLTPA